MRAEQLMTREMWTCRPEDTLDRAAQLMWDHDCGCLPVVGSDGATRIEGLITDRDICMCALFQSKPLYDMRVSDAMTRRVRSCKGADALSAVERAMAEARVRRLPVIDERSALIGMISLADLAREAARDGRQPSPEIMKADIGDALAAICRSTAATGA